MEIIEFKKYCKKQQTSLEGKLKEIKKRLNNIPPAEKIVLPIGEERNHLENEYRLTRRLTLRNRLFGITDLELQKFIASNEEKTLKEEASDLENHLSNLQVITSAKKNELTHIPSSNDYLVLTLLEYCLENKFTSATTLEHLLELFRLEKTGEPAIISSYEKDILRYFKYNGQIDHENVQTVLFLFNKLTNQILPTEQYKYSELINGLKEEIKNRSTIIFNHHIIKSDLLSKKEAIGALKEYINNDEIIKSANSIEDFTLLLKKAGVSEQEANHYIAKMRMAMSEEKQKRDIASVEKVLTTNEIDTLKEANILLEKDTSDEQKELISRLIKDIVSICRYFEIGIPVEEQNTTREILCTKVHLLHETVKMVKKPIEETSTYRYIVNDDGVPNIIRNIEALDPMYYPSIYSKLINIPNIEVPSSAFVIDDIDFYIAHAKEVSIVYSIINAKRILICATIQKDVKYIEKNIPKQVIKILTEMKNHPKENQELEQNYENLLIKLLDLNNGIKNKTLKK